MEWIAVAALATAVTAALVLGQFTARVDAVIYDAFSKLAVHAPSDDIIIVAIDNRSIAALGRWPWPRTRHAELLQRLADARPRAIAYDVLFVEPDHDPAADQTLAAAVTAAAPTFLPMTFDVPGENGAAFRPVPPAGPLAAAAAGVGQVNVAFDADGIVRRTFLSERDSSHDWPHLMALVAGRFPRAATPARSAAERSPAPADGLVRRRPIWIAFSGAPGRYRTVSFVDVLRGEVPAVFLRGKAVLVGATADGLGDRYSTPLSADADAMSGVELQANVLDDLLNGRTIRPLGPIALLCFALGPLWLLLAGFLRLRPRQNMLLGAGLLVASLTLSAALFVLAGVWAPPMAGLIGLFLVYPLWSWRRLEATSAYMVAELDQFAREAGALPDLGDAASRRRGEIIDHQLDLMHRTIRHAQDLRRFVTDVLQGLPDATVVVDTDQRVLLANLQAEALFASLHAPKLTGAPLAGLIAALDPALDPALAGEAIEPAGDVEMSAPDGRVFSVRRQQLLDAAGVATGWVVRFSDVSPIKAAARQREDVLQLLTHDMRSPQVSILALLDGPDGPATPAGLAARISGYARRTLALADNFVHLARAEAQSYAFETVDLGDMVLDAVDDLWPQSSAKGVTVAVDACEGEWPIQADRSLLTRAMINLIDNAIKYTDPGGRVICRIERHGATDPPMAVCTIADTGRGMTADQSARLFGRFERAPSEGRSRADGVGLGLVFVHTVIQRHGGSIRGEGRIGEGSTFTVTLPLAASDAPAP